MPDTVDDPTADAYDQLFSNLEDARTAADDEPEPDDDVEDVPDELEADEDGDEADEGDGGDDVEGGDEDPDGPVEVDDDTVVRFKDGTELKLSEAVLKDKDYTQKTQQLAEQRRELEQRQKQVDEQQEKLEGFVARFEQDPPGTLSKLLQATPDPTLATAQLLRQMAESGALEEEFARVFVGEQPIVRQKAEEAGYQDRLNKVEQTVQQREEQERQARQRQEAIASYQKQWSEVVREEGLQFEDPGQEQEVLRGVLELAVRRNIYDLPSAYAAYAWEQERDRRRQESESQQEQKKARVGQRKQKARAVTPRSAGGGGGKTPSKPQSDEDAIRASLDELLAG